MDSAQIPAQNHVADQVENKHYVKPLEKPTITRQRLKQLTIPWVPITDSVNVSVSKYGRESFPLASAPQAPSGCLIFSSTEIDFAPFPGKWTPLLETMNLKENYDASDESDTEIETYEEEAMHDFSSNDSSTKASDLGVAGLLVPRDETTKSEF